MSLIAPETFPITLNPSGPFLPGKLQEGHWRDFEGSACHLAPPEESLINLTLRAAFIFFTFLHKHDTRCADLCLQ